MWGSRASIFDLLGSRLFLLGVSTGIRVGTVCTHRLHSSSFLGLPYRILNMNPQKGTTLEPLGNIQLVL